MLVCWWAMLSSSLVEIRRWTKETSWTTHCICSTHVRYNRELHTNRHNTDSRQQPSNGLVRSLQGLALQDVMVTPLTFSVASYTSSEAKWKATSLTILSHLI